MRKTHISVISSVLLVSLSIAARAQQQHTITTVAGGLPNNVPATQAPIAAPLAVFMDSAGNLYTAEHTVRGLTKYVKDWRTSSLRHQP